jgi:hypothetical protein
MSTTRRLFVGDKIRVANGDRHGPGQLASARTADILLRRMPEPGQAEVGAP